MTYEGKYEQAVVDSFADLTVRQMGTVAGLEFLVRAVPPIRSADLEQGLPYRARGNLGNLDETEIMFPEMPQLWSGTLDLVSLANIQEGAAEVHGRSGRRAFILVASDYTCKTARVSIGQGTDGAGATPALPRLLDGKEAHEARVGNGLADANSRLRW